MGVFDRSILIVADVTLVWRYTMYGTLILMLGRLIILSLLPLHSHQLITHFFHYYTIVLHLLFLILHPLIQIVRQCLHHGLNPINSIR